jgi:prevent-host-death family protein
VAEAKAKFSDMIAEAAAHGPQKITRHGTLAAVVIAAKDWRKASPRRGTLADFFAASPLAGSGIAFERPEGRPRKIALR